MFAEMASNDGIQDLFGSENSKNADNGSSNQETRKEIALENPIYNSK